jgi:rRNA processing protein Krr1/Pno1
MIREEHDDIIATLEQENRQLHARNERLQKELDAASTEGLEALRQKLKLDDPDKFNVFRTTVRLIGACFDSEKNCHGLLLVDKGDTMCVVGLNADVEQIAELSSYSLERAMELLESMGEDRVLN